MLKESQEDSETEEDFEEEEDEVSEAESNLAYMEDDVQKLLWDIDGINPNDYLPGTKLEGHDA